MGKIKNIFSLAFAKNISLGIVIYVGLMYVVRIMHSKDLSEQDLTIISSVFAALLGSTISHVFQVLRDNNERAANKMEREEEKKAIEEEKTDLEKVKLQSCFYKMHTLLRNLGIIYLRILDLNKPEMRGRKIPIAGMQIKFNDYDLQFLVLKIPLLLEGITQLEVDQNDLFQQLEELSENNHGLLYYDNDIRLAVMKKAIEYKISMMQGALGGTIAQMYAKIISLMCVIDKYLQNKYSAETLRKDYVKENMDKAEKFVTEMDEKNPDLKLKETMGGWTIKV